MKVIIYDLLSLDLLGFRHVELDKYFYFDPKTRMSMQLAVFTERVKRLRETAESAEPLT